MDYLISLVISIVANIVGVLFARLLDKRKPRK